MKVVLFCGGFGTRLREYSETLPKPLVEIGYRPIVWHLMKYYAHFGHTEFILCLGYRGDLIKHYFVEYQEWLSNDFTLRKQGTELTLHNTDISDWTITFVDTGLQSNIGQRLLAVRRHIDGDNCFLANYSDGLSNIPLDRQIKEFEASKSVVSFAAVRPSSSLSGVWVSDNGQVEKVEYLQTSGVWINGGFFVMTQSVFDYIEPGEELVETPFQRLIDAKKLHAYRHGDFWAAMDTFKDKKLFDEMYESGQRPWMLWDSRTAAKE
jgi:glucose-1-phosphate cytidylyltransferase